MDINSNSFQAQQQNDEIDLLTLLATLWQNRKTIISITLCCTIIVITIAFIMTPSYQSRSVLKPINPHSLYALNNLNIYSITAESLFTDVEKELHSYRNQENFLLENEDLLGPILKEITPELKEQVVDEFLTRNFNIKYPEKESTRKQLTLELTYPKGVKGPTIINRFIQTVSEKVKKEIPETIKIQINAERNDLQDQLAILLAGYNAKVESDVAALIEQDNLKRLQLQDELKALQVELKTKRDNRISVLNEAIEIAETLNFKKPTSYNAESSKTQSSNIIRAEITQQQTPLYFLGTDVLMAERDALLARTTDDFTSSKIAEIESELQLLRNNRKIEIIEAREHPDLFLEEISSIKQKLMELNIIERSINDTITPLLTTFDIVTIDEKALAPRTPLKPNKKLIAIIGFLLGGMLAIMFVLMRQSIRNHQLKPQNSER